MPAEHTCGTCKHLSIPWGSHGLRVCRAPLPMWADDGDREAVDEDADATNCAAYEEARDD